MLATGLLPCNQTVGDPAGDDPQTGRPARLNLVTVTETIYASTPDVVMTPDHPRRHGRPGLPPGELVVDSAYASAEELLSASAASP